MIEPDAGRVRELLTKEDCDDLIDAIQVYVPKANRPEWDHIVRKLQQLAAAPTESAGTLEVIVNGQPVVVKAGPVREVIAQAIQQSGQIGAPIAQWQLRTTEGELIPHALLDGTDYELSPGRRLWLNLGLPVSALRAEEGRRPK